MKGRNGVVYQAGMGVQDKNRPSRTPNYFGKYRAVVINVTPTDDLNNIQGKEVLCDIVTIRDQIPLVGVPVAASVGVSDGSIWSPKPTTGTVSGDPLVLPRLMSKRGTFEGDPTPANDYNGDMVLIEFIEGLPEFPMITDRWTHDKTRRTVVAGDGWNNTDQTGNTQRGKPELNEMYQRFAGTELRVNKLGDVLVDTAGANHLIEDPLEVPALAVGGELRVRIKDGNKLVVAFPLGGDIFEIAFNPAAGLPSAGPNQQFVRGTSFIINLNALVAQLILAFGALVIATPPGPLSGLNAGFTSVVAALTAFQTALANPLDPPLSNFIRGD